VEFREARQWRVFKDETSGQHFMLFDPLLEVPATRDLAADEKIDYLDSVVSVSGLGEGEGSVVSDGCTGPAQRYVQGLLPF